MASLGHQITEEQTDELIHEFDVDEKNRGSSTIINENEHDDK